MTAQQFMWAAEGSTDKASEGIAIGIDAAGNSYFSGAFDGILTLGDTTLVSYTVGNASRNFFVSRYDMAGNFIWAKQGTGSVNDNSMNIAVDDMGNHYFTGRIGDQDSVMFGDTTLYNNGIEDKHFVAKCSYNGNFLYARSFGSRDMGGKSAISSSTYDIENDTNGDFYVTGEFGNGVNNWTIGDSVFSTSNSAEDIFLAKFNMDGDFLWALRSFGDDENEGYGLAIDNAGNVFVVGSIEGTGTLGNVVFNSTANTRDIFVAKFGSNGNLIWFRQFGGPETDEGYGIALDDIGDVYITGEFQGTINVNGSIITASGAGTDEGWIAKYDSNGNFIWIRQFGGVMSESVWSISSNQFNICVAGSFGGTATFGDTTITSSGDFDAFIAKYDLDGNFISVVGMGGSDYDEVREAVLDDENNAYLTGFYRATADIGDTTFTTLAFEDTFIAKFGNDAVLLAPVVPTLSEWAVMILGLVMIIMGALAVRPVMKSHSSKAN